MRDRFGYSYYQFIDVEKGLIDEEPEAPKEEEKKETTVKVPKNPPKDVSPAISAHRYAYNGPIYQKMFGKTRCVIDRYKRETRACTKAKAISNIIYNAKCYCGVQPYTGGFFLDEKYLKILED